MREVAREVNAATSTCGRAVVVRSRRARGARSFDARLAFAKALRTDVAADAVGARVGGCAADALRAVAEDRARSDVDRRAAGAHIGERAAARAAAARAPAASGAARAAAAAGCAADGRVDLADVERSASGGPGRQRGARLRDRVSGHARSAG